MKKILISTQIFLLGAAVCFQLAIAGDFVQPIPVEWKEECSSNKNTCFYECIDGHTKKKSSALDLSAKYGNLTCVKCVFKDLNPNGQIVGYKVVDPSKCEKI